MLRVALLGAESSGKTHLAHSLAHYAEQSGLRVQVMSEPLRTWCKNHQRTPDADEQMQIARQHGLDLHRSMKAARQALPPVDLFIADTSPLQTAAYRAYYFQGHDLDASALRSHEKNFDVSLLMGLDLPWIADPGQRSGPGSQIPVDTQLRRLLNALAGHSYSLVYGQGVARAESAWRLVAPRLARHPADLTANTRLYECACCSDPVCERRLFSRLRSLVDDSFAGT